MDYMEQNAKTYKPSNYAQRFTTFTLTLPAIDCHTYVHIGLEDYYMKNEQPIFCRKMPEFTHDQL